MKINKIVSIHNKNKKSKVTECILQSWESGVFLDFLKEFRRSRLFLDHFVNRDYFRCDRGILSRIVVF